MSAAPPIDTPARIGDLIALYRRTHYGVRCANRNDAVICIGARVPAAVDAWLGDDACAFYMSAANPFSRHLDSAANTRRTARLRRDLSARQARFAEGDAGIPGQTWRETSLLVAGMTREAAIEVARDYRQNAIVAVPRRGHATLLMLRDDWRDAMAQPSA